MPRGSDEGRPGLKISQSGDATSITNGISKEFDTSSELCMALGEIRSAVSADLDEQRIWKRMVGPSLSYNAQDQIKDIVYHVNDLLAKF